MLRSWRSFGIAALCLLTVACSGGSTAPTGGAPQQPPQFPLPPIRPPVQPLPPAATQAPAPPFPFPAATSAPATANYPGPVDFEDAGVNPFVDPLRDRYSTFAMDV